MLEEDTKNIVNAIVSTNGNIAEVGTYRGDTAEMICRVKGNRHLYLFDTWKGLPEVVPEIKTTTFVANIEEVKKRLKKYPNVHFIKGVFPKTAGIIKDKKFSVVHLDCDLYEGILAGLRLFYPISEYVFIHDYPTFKGVKEAVEQFTEEMGIKGQQTSIRQICLKRRNPKKRK